MAKNLFKNSKIQCPIKINSTYYPESQTMELEILEPESNMQENPAAFEGWTLLLLSRGICKKVILKFKSLEIDNKFYFDSVSAEKRHYFRFIYRLTKFSKQFKDIFSISESNRKDMQLFQEHFLKIKKVNDFPKKISSYNPNYGLEHILEQGLASDEKLRKEYGIDFPLFNQLPNGLFQEAVEEKNRIFCKGRFDLWGISPEDTFNLFELKEPKNKQVGVISELYFYANFAHDLLNEKDNFFLNKTKSDFRGYNLFSNGQLKKVKAYFLVHSFHSEIKDSIDNIMNLLNTNSPIEFSYIYYSLSDKKTEEITKFLKNHLN
ncbi:MAG: hypothetical protein IV090_17130 [Candidatus Sericytochromatia bacterium]|nr:hypothetical protein [Candidatus Sericytochromatia bacterium]